MYFCVQFWYEMTEDEKTLLSKFEARLRHLIFLHDELKRENRSLRQQLEEEQIRVAGLKEELAKKTEDYTNLKIARTISTEEDVKETKQKLSRLVREIDKCIALLNE